MALLGLSHFKWDKLSENFVTKPNIHKSFFNKNSDTEVFQTKAVIIDTHTYMYTYICIYGIS